MRSIGLLVVVLGACTTANTAGSVSATCQDLTAAPANPPANWSGSVFTIVMENHSRGEIFGNKDAPFINSLAAQGAVANGYHDSYVHPSEANYLWMVAGENFDILDDDDPISHSLPATSHIADQLEKAGLSWKTYQEGMGAPCGLVSHDRYAAKHDPFVFFSDINGWDGKQFQTSQRCIDHVVDYSQLANDIAANAIPKYVFITPNLDDDMHDGTVAQGDTWLSHEIPKIMATDAYKNGGVIYLLWDEGGGSPAADDPPFITLSPYARAGMQSTTDFDTSSYLKTVEKITGVAALPCDAEAASVVAMDELYTMPMAQP